MSESSCDRVDRSVRKAAALHANQPLLGRVLRELFDDGGDEGVAVRDAQKVRGVKGRRRPGLGEEGGELDELAVCESGALVGVAKEDQLARHQRDRKSVV